MKKYLNDLLIGIFLGILLILIPPLVKGGGIGFVGGEFIQDLFPQLDNEILELVVAGLIYMVLAAIIPFIIYTLTAWYKKHHQRNPRALFFSFLFFSLGTFIVYLIFIGIFLYLFSKNFGF
jgi:hypothetical protein